MKPHFGVVSFSLSILLALTWSSSTPGPSARAVQPPPAPTRGGWTTGSTGALGDVVYGPGTHVIDLAVEGVYDPVNWRVVFDFATLTVQSGATITFSNHPTRAPVVWRATGDVSLAGLIRLEGQAGHNPLVVPFTYSKPGPGGFRGGIPTQVPFVRGCAGFGPGGGFLGVGAPGWGGGNGSHRTSGATSSLLGAPGPIYGSPSGLPLVGGSGAAGGNSPTTSLGNGGGGAGGGAILIGSDTRIDLAGRISVNGGVTGGVAFSGAWGGHGSGGTLRLVAPVITQAQNTGPLTALGGGSGGGAGGIRIETDGDPGVNWYCNPAPSQSWTLGEFLPELPRVTLQSWWDEELDVWVPIGQDPSAEIQPPAAADVQLPDAGVRTVRLEGHDVPLGAVLHVRVVGTEGAQVVLDSTHTMGEVAGSTLALSWTNVPIDFSQGVTAVQVRAELP